MHNILCTIGIHVFDKWIDIRNKDGTVYVVKTCHPSTAPSEFSYKQEMVQSRLCGHCGIKQIRRVTI